MKTRVILSLLFLLSFGSVRAADLFIEAESFSNKGGWEGRPAVYGFDGIALFVSARDGCTCR